MPVYLGAKERIIVALDTQDVTEVTRLVRLLSPEVGMFKAGFELTEAVGTQRAIRAIQSSGGKVFRDGKFLDIPNTVGKASEAVSAFEPDFFNVHIQAGNEALKRAVAGKGKSQVLGVSLLTSLDAREILEMFVKPFIDMTGEGDFEYAMTVLGASSDYKKEVVDAAADRRTEYLQRVVLGLAEKAAVNGLDGLICSPRELVFLTEHGSRAVRALLKVVPGIRMAGSVSDDQVRIDTPFSAITGGADYLVIGRPIVNADDPVAAARAIAAEIDHALDSL